MTITPSGNSESWVVNAVFDPTWCNASVDFNVPGKPAPPPVNLTATVLLSYTLGPDVHKSRRRCSSSQTRAGRSLILPSL